MIDEEGSMLQGKIFKCNIFFFGGLYDNNKRFVII